MTSNIKPTLALAALALTGLINTASAGAWILDFATPWVQQPGWSANSSTWTKTFSSVDPQAQTGISTIYGYYDEAANTLQRGPLMVTAKIEATVPLSVQGSLLGSTSPLTLAGAPNASPYALYTLSLYADSAMTIPTSVDNLIIYAWDIDSDPSASSMTDIWGWKNPGSHTSVNAGSQITPAGSIPGYTTLGTSSLGENVPDNNLIPWIPEHQRVHAVGLHYNSFSSGDFVWGFTGNEANSVTRTHNLLGIIAPEPGSAMTAFLTGAAMVGLVNRRKRQS
jgi:hypothetical protein